MSDRRETRESPVLREVAVKRKGGVDLEAFHQGKPNRVGMVPIISIEKRVPRAGIHEDKGGGH